jgi:UDP-N-acetylglucosamine acyltransferase
MESLIHPTALIDPTATIAEGVFVGPYAIVEAGVDLGAGVRVEAQAQVLTGTKIGAGSVIGRAAVIGGLPQDVHFDTSIVSGVRLGEKCIIREHVTINRATKAGVDTTLGEGNYLMTGCHVGHDCMLGAHNIIANATLFAGHVTMGDRNVVGGGSVFHQFVRIGSYCMFQGMSGFSKDIAPFMMGVEINRVAGLNVIGLRRAGFDAAARGEIKRLFDLIWRGTQPFKEAVASAAAQSWGGPAAAMLAFLQAPSQKGVCLALGRD